MSTKHHKAHSTSVDENVLVALLFVVEEVAKSMGIMYAMWLMALLLPHCDPG